MSMRVTPFAAALISGLVVAAGGCSSAPCTRIWKSG